ncbi:hypothetical protein PGB90_007229 [Kerria lacca]
MANRKIKFSQKIVLLDNEGTIVTCNYVKNVLMKFALNKLKKDFDELWKIEKFRSAVEKLKEKFAENIANNIQVRPVSENETEKESLLKNVVWHLQLGRESNVLHLMRDIEGYILKNALLSKELPKLEVFEDVKPALKLWKEKGRKLYIYSSAGEEEQSYFCAYTSVGNIGKYFSKFFDLNMGSKTDTTSFTAIAKFINCSTNDILYITDTPKEAEAAKKAGCKVLIIDRPSNDPCTPDDKAKFEFITSFDQLIPEE